MNNRNKVRHLLLLTLLSTLICVSFQEKELQQLSKPKKTPLPNIIVIIADDMGWDAFGKYPGMNGIKARTPTLDSLSATGITFTNYWVNPECSPSRAAMLTGKYGFRTGIGGVAGNSSPTLNPKETIIQKYINEKKQGTYATAVIGKWHISGNELKAPEGFGVEYFAGFLSGTVPDYYRWTQTSGGKQEPVTTYTTTHFVNQASSWMKVQTKPFFLWLAFNAPHTPFQAPPKELVSTEGLSFYQKSSTSPTMVQYLSSIEAMDKEIGRLISSMTTQQRQNTIFLFMGDNGTPARVAQTPFSSKAAKSSLFQGGINTPLLVSGAQISRKDIIEPALVQATDIFATVAELAGVTKTDLMDGQSMAPLFNNAEAKKRAFVYSELFGSSQFGNNGYALRNLNYKFIHLSSGKEYLYKIGTDPFEKSNLLEKPLDAEGEDNLKILKKIKQQL
ncbi:MAG: sulfatase [Pedobacter sp.]|nr:MAG: sulfatase [Pedobacter sp.]